MLKKKGGGAEKKAMREAVPRNQTTRCYKTGRPCQDFFLCFFFVFSLFFLCFFFVFSLFFLCFSFCSAACGRLLPAAAGQGEGPCGACLWKRQASQYFKTLSFGHALGGFAPPSPRFFARRKRGVRKGGKCVSPLFDYFSIDVIIK